MGTTYSRTSEDAHLQNHRLSSGVAPWGALPYFPIYMTRGGEGYLRLVPVLCASVPPCSCEPRPLRFGIAPLFEFPRVFRCVYLCVYLFDRGGPQEKSFSLTPALLCDPGWDRRVDGSFANGGDGYRDECDDEPKQSGQQSLCEGSRTTTVAHEPNVH
ncbi:unnamed protein product [Ectocarpus sp. 8 AP-2014]